MGILGTSRATATLAALMIVLAGAACSSTSPQEKPTRADIEVTGTAPQPLRLVVSGDFFEGVDENGSIVQTLIDADTSFITLPYQESVTLSSLGSVYVDVTNVEGDPATVRLRVVLDSGQDFCPGVERTLTPGGAVDALRCVFVFLQRTL